MARNVDADIWPMTYDNPMRPVTSEIRDVVLQADVRVSEAFSRRASTHINKGNVAICIPTRKRCNSRPTLQKRLS